MSDWKFNVGDKILWNSGQKLWTDYAYSIKARGMRNGRKVYTIIWKGPGDEKEDSTDIITKAIVEKCGVLLNEMGEILYG